MIMNKNARFILISLFFFFFKSIFAFSDSGVKIDYNGGKNYILVERTDLLRYDNNKYTGLLSREVQSYISYEGTEKDGSLLYDGSFFVVEETKHNKKSVRRGIRTSIDSSFKITKDGELIMLEDNGYPSFRSFPSYAGQKIKIGDTWQTTGIRAVDPQNNGTVTQIPFFAEYKYERDDVYNGEDVYVLSAKWATRYGLSYVDEHGDPNLQTAQGSHNALIIISKKVGNAVVVKDTVDETFVYADGQQVRLKGTISLFTRYPPSYNAGDVIRKAQHENIKTEQAARNDKNQKAVSKAADKDSKTQTKNDAVLSSNDTTISESDRGLVLIMRNLMFKSDSAELLPGESSRLDKIAEVLKSVPDAQYLVEGHTADTGNPFGEKKLSEERASVIAEELSMRGIPAEQFICRGMGAKKPVADNSTAEGKAANRRVEITILR